MKIFYDNLVNLHDLHVEFDRLDVPVEEREELVNLADSAMHHEIFDLIMFEVPDEHREIFLESFGNDPSDESILVFLRIRVPGIEDKIRQRAEAVKRSFIEDLGTNQ
jgi:hypothetical protein